MGKIVVSETTYGSYGNCVKLTNGTLEVLVTVDQGPYVIRCGFVGEENLFFEDVDGAFTNDVTESRFAENSWCVVGGHRLWASPEIHPRTYYPANRAVHVEYVDGGAVFTAPEQEWNQVQNSIRITMDEDGTVHLLHSVTNRNAWAIELAPWTVSVMDDGGTALIPQNVRKTGFYPNKWVQFWDYTPMNDSRLYLGENFITLSIDKEKELAAKIGVLNEHGWMAYFNHGAAFIKQFDFTDGANYPDHGCNCESYTCRKYTEMECLGPLQLLETDATATLAETWKVVKSKGFTGKNEAEMAAAVKALNL